MQALDRSFFARPVHEVAPDLLHKVLVGPNGRGRIVEVEAYGGADDPGSHAFRGPTPRTEPMFGPPGYLYVYFIYGMHWCANAVTGPDGDPSAVLIRALEPLEGIEAMTAARTAKRRVDTLPVRQLCSGPAKLCQALGIDGAHNTADLTVVEGVWIGDSGQRPPEPVIATRVGLSAGEGLPWRYLDGDSPHVSMRAGS